jgi:hypothetical protein
MPKTFLSFSDLALIFATLLGPVLAIQVQKLLEHRREKKIRRNQIFKTLMATRAARLSGVHVEALNLIDIEFSPTNAKDKKVRNAWKAYFAHLGEKNEGPEAQMLWSAKRDDLFTDLLYELGTALGYDFDKTQIKHDVYSPIYHGNLEQEERLIRSKVIEILTGKAAFPMTVVSVPADSEAATVQTNYLKMMAEFVREGKPFPVVIVGNEAATPKVISMRPAESTQTEAPKKPSDTANTG